MHVEWAWFGTNANNRARKAPLLEGLEKEQKDSFAAETAQFLACIQLQWPVPPGAWKRSL